jgi:hypothetical protein
MFAGHPVRRAVYRLIKPLLGLSVCVVLRVRRGRSCPAPLPDPRASPRDRRSRTGSEAFYTAGAGSCGAPVFRPVRGVSVGTRRNTVRGSPLDLSAGLV